MFQCRQQLTDAAIPCVLGSIQNGTITVSSSGKSLETIRTDNDCNSSSGCSTGSDSSLSAAVCSKETNLAKRNASELVDIQCTRIEADKLNQSEITSQKTLENDFTPNLKLMNGSLLIDKHVIGMVCESKDKKDRIDDKKERINVEIEDCKDDMIQAEVWEISSPSSSEDSATEVEEDLSEKASSVQTVSTPPASPKRSKGRFPCKKCEKTFKFHKGLLKHMRTHRQQKLNCLTCAAQFTTSRELQQHLATHTQAPGSRESDQGSRRHPALDRYDDSIVRAFSCSLCSYRAKQKRDLKKHMTIHTSSNVHKCHLCKFSSKRKYSLRRHLSNVHNTVQTYECKVCGFKVASLETYQAHMTSHRSMSITSCVICGIRIQDKENLVEHLISHSVTQKKSCQECQEMHVMCLEHMRHMLSHQVKPDVDQDSEGHAASTPAASWAGGSEAGIRPLDLTSLVTRLADLSRESDQTHKVTVLAEIHALAKELVLVSGSLMHSQQSLSTSAPSSTHPMRTRAASLRTPSLDESSILNDDFELTSVLDFNLAAIKEECQDVTFPPTDSDMQIEVDLNGLPVSCIRADADGQRSHHRKDLNLVCMLCNAVMNDTRSLKRHLMGHVDARPWACDRCSQSFRRREHLKKHMTTHSIERPYVCIICQYGAKTEERLKYHMLSHSEERLYACHLCSYSGMTAYDLRQHAKNHKPKTCPVCGLLSHSRAEYRKHLSTHAPFKCCDCEFSSSDRMEYNKHVRLHSKVEHLCCELCGYSCDTIRKFNYHKLRHENKTPFQCQDCDYKCSSRASYDCHRLKHAGLKPFLCSFCGASFVKTSHLNQHMLIHKDEKAFTCGVCGYSCRTKHNMKEHEMTHGGEKPYACKYCALTFRRKKAMMIHMAKH